MFWQIEHIKGKLHKKSLQSCSYDKSDKNITRSTPFLFCNYFPSLQLCLKKVMLEWTTISSRSNFLFNQKTLRLACKQQQTFFLQADQLKGTFLDRDRFEDKNRKWNERRTEGKDKQSSNNDPQGQKEIICDIMRKPATHVGTTKINGHRLTFSWSLWWLPEGPASVSR